MEVEDTPQLLPIRMTARTPVPVLILNMHSGKPYRTNLVVFYKIVLGVSASLEELVSC